MLSNILTHSESENGPIKFAILDARRQIAAALNMAAGKGTEDISLYPNSELIFCDIDNIHVMRASAQVCTHVRDIYQKEKSCVSTYVYVFNSVVYENKHQFC